MLSLESPRWAKLSHAYGSAGDVPAMLAELRLEAASDAEPWRTLWSALAHQGDVYSASFAAVPHVVQLLASAPERADSTFFGFPAWVEICRHSTGAPVPEDLSSAYFEALAVLLRLCAQATSIRQDPGHVASVLAALAATSGQHVMAEVIFEMASPEASADILHWLQER